MIYVLARQLEMLKIAFKKVTTSPLPVFFAIAQAKIRILLLNFVNFSTNVPENLVADATLMLGKVLEVLRRYLPPLSSYR